MLRFGQNQRLDMLNLEMLNMDQCKKLYHKVVLIYHPFKRKVLQLYAVYLDKQK